VAAEQKGRDVQCPHCGKHFPALANASATQPSAHAAPPDSPLRMPQPPAGSAVIRFSCPNCDRVLEVPSDQAGSKFPCPSCRQRLQVPPSPLDQTVLGKNLHPSQLSRPPTGLEPEPLKSPGPPPDSDEDEPQPRQLIVLAGPDKGKVFPLPQEGTVRIGRAANAEVRLVDIRVSRAHCQLQVSADQVMLAAPEGQRSAQVNDERITAERLLRPGDVLRIGESELRFDVPDVAELKTVYGDVKEALRRLAGAGKITVTCSCGQKLVAREKYAGTRLRCPCCEEFITLPGKSARGPRLETPSTQDLEDLGESTAAEAESAPQPRRPQRTLFAVIILSVLALLGLVALGTLYWNKGSP
jgi:predicted RNA-binding Zn-ribbon protein involved in translation (DUF1610 family)